MTKHINAYGDFEHSTRIHFNTNESFGDFYDRVFDHLKSLEMTTDDFSVDMHGGNENYFTFTFHDPESLMLFKLSF